MTALVGYSVPETITDDAGNVLKSLTVQVTGPAAYTGTAVTGVGDGVLRLGPLPVGDYTVTNPLSGRSVVIPVVAAAADVQSAFDKAAAAIPLTQKGAVNGVASLDGAGTVPDAQIPATIARDAEVTSAVSAAVAALVASAPGALDTLAEIDAQLAADESAAAALTTAVAGKDPLQRVVTPAVTAAGALAVNKLTPVDATAGAVAMTLPTGQAEGTQIAVAKVDNTTNAVTITGNIRGAAGQSLSLALYREGILFRADSAGSWWPIADHKTLSSLDARFLTPSAAAGTYSKLGGRYKKWSDMPAGFVIPHRGGGANVAPDNTLEAFRIGAGYGLGLLDGGDLRTLSDGTIAVMHDRDLRYTTLTGLGVLVDELTGTGWQQVVIDAGRWFGGNWSSTLKAPTFSQLLTEFGRDFLLTPEWKNDQGGTGYIQIVDRIVQAGQADRCLFNSFSSAACAYAVAQGITNVCLNVTPADVPATKLTEISGMGITYIGISTITALADATITAYVTAGMKVILAGCVRQWQKTYYDALGVTGYYGDDPVYFAGDVTKYRRTTAPWTKSGTFYHGHLSPTGAIDANRGQFVGSAGAYRWQPTLDGYNLQGWACPLANAAGTYTITVPYTFDTLPSDMTKWASVLVCSPNDRAYNATGAATDNGYHVLMRANGTVQIYKILNGVTTGPIVQNVTGVALLAGQVASLKIDVTPTTVTATATINGAVQTGIQVTDSANRGGFFYLGNSGSTSSSMRVSAGAITIT